MDGPARRLLDDRVQQIGEELARREERLREVERQLAGLIEAEVDAEWVAATLRDFDAVYENLTPDNRARLLRALVARIDVDEPHGTVEIQLADLSALAETGVASPALDEEEDA